MGLRFRRARGGYLLSQGGAKRSGQVRSGQVRSECLKCTFRASCCSARLSRAQVFVGSSVRDIKLKMERVRGTACTGGYKGVRAVRPESVAGGGWFEVLWNLGCPVRLSQKEICAHFNDGNVGAIWTVRRKIELWSYVVSFEFSRPKVAQAKR